MAAALAETAEIALLASSYVKHSGLLGRMRREILCDGGSLVRADSTSASIRGSAIITSSVNLMTQLYAQVDSSPWPLAHARAQWATGDGGGDGSDAITDWLCSALCVLNGICFRLRHAAHRELRSVLSSLLLSPALRAVLSLLVLVQGHDRLVGTGQNRHWRDRLRE